MGEGVGWGEGLHFTYILTGVFHKDLVFEEISASIF